jgi:hypothetical protein
MECYDAPVADWDGPDALAEVGLQVSAFRPTCKRPNCAFQFIELSVGHVLSGVLGNPRINLQKVP